MDLELRTCLCFYFQGGKFHRKVKNLFVAHFLNVNFNGQIKFEKFSQKNWNFPLNFHSLAWTQTNPAENLILRNSFHSLALKSLYRIDMTPKWCESEQSSWWWKRVIRFWCICLNDGWCEEVEEKREKRRR